MIFYLLGCLRENQRFPGVDEEDNYSRWERSFGKRSIDDVLGSPLKNRDCVQILLPYVFHVAKNLQRIIQINLLTDRGLNLCV